MVKRHKLSISFKSQYQHVYEHLQSIPNKSDYIAKAVEAYMNRKQDAASHEEIRKIVMEILQNQGIHSSVQIPSSPSQVVDLISEEDTDLINQLF
ncbi:hypothetical protein [Brevibacillus borstelensis]|jgi:hypothetical protein|uniref:hypothetical protein n=1 Tax=Brevibacillus borstelensis TaxID=45462 RepID=UPI00203AD157|nr:hypothetical protein [Brevibacillus borstelensis]MCM3472186.1 hypothetical protein [Brevibacillus borstelensis]